MATQLWRIVAGHPPTSIFGASSLVVAGALIGYRQWHAFRRRRLQYCTVQHACEPWTLGGGTTRKPFRTTLLQYVSVTPSHLDYCQESQVASTAITHSAQTHRLCVRKPERLSAIHDSQSISRCDIRAHLRDHEKNSPIILLSEDKM